MPVFLPTPPPPRKRKKDRSVGGFLANVLGDVPELVRSIGIDLPVSLGTGVGRSAADIWRFATPTERGVDWSQLAHTGERLARTTHGFAQGVENFIPKHRELEHKLFGNLANKQIIGRNEKGDWDFWFDWEDPEDAGSAADAWYNDPLLGFLNVGLPAAGTITRAGSIAKLAGTIRKANPELSAGSAWKLGSVESRHPGVLAAHGIKGGLPERKLGIDLGAEKRTEWSQLSEPGLTVNLPRSGSPIGRGLEAGYDIASLKLPGRFSEEARAARFESRQQRERLRQTEAEVKGLSQPIIDAAYSYGEGAGSKTWNFLRGEMERNPTATALSALVQLPREMAPREALQAYLRSREQILAEGSHTKPVYQSLEDADNPQIHTGQKVAYVNPSERPVWTLEDANAERAIISRGDETVIADPADVFPLKQTSQGRYGPAYAESVPLDAESAALIRKEMSEIRRWLENPPSEQKLGEALNAMERISALVEQYGLHLNGRGLSGADRAKLAARYDRRKQLLVNDLVARGLIPEGMEARGYFPHFSLWRNLSANWTGPVRLPGSGRVVGRTQLPSDVGRNAANNLVLHTTGQVLMDPAALLYLLTRRLRVMETYASRKDYWDIAVPLKDAPKGTGGYLIRDPDAAAKAISDRTKAQLDLSDSDWEKLVNSGEDTASVLDDADANAAEIGEFLSARDRSLPAWSGEEGVRWLPAHVVEARFGSRVFRGETPAALGLANALARVALILGRPLRYAASNVPANTLMLAATHPEALLEMAKIMANRGRIPGVPRVLMQQIRSQSGEVKAHAGIPSFGTSRVRPVEKAEEYVSRQSSRMADSLGSAVDEPWRLAAWVARAKKMGFRDPDDWARLLNAPEDSALGRARQQIRQRARDDMLDFDSMTQWEREKGTRYLFVWPYLRAALKYPFVYARERPVVTGLLANAATAAPNQPLPHPLGAASASSELQTPWGTIDFSQANPLSPLADFAGTASSLAHGDMAAAFDYLSPTLRQVMGAKDRDPKQIAAGAASTFVPFGPVTKHALENGLTDALKNEAIRYEPQHPFAYISRDKRDELRKVRNVYGETMLKDPEVARDFDAYWSYKDAEARSLIGAKERGHSKLTNTEKTLLLKLVWKHYRPDEPFPDFGVVNEKTVEATGKLLFAYRSALAHGLPTADELASVGYEAPP